MCDQSQVFQKRDTCKFGLQMLSATAHTQLGDLMVQELSFFG